MKVKQFVAIDFYIVAFSSIIFPPQAPLESAINATILIIAALPASLLIKHGSFKGAHAPLFATRNGQAK